MIFYFYGENSFAISQRIDDIKQQYVKKTGGSSDMETFDMSERNLSDLLNSLAVVPMFVSSRLIIVRDLSTQKLSADKLQELLDTIPSSTNIIITDSKVDKRSVYFKKLSKQKNSKNFALLMPVQLVGWVKQEIEKYHAKADNRTISLLIERVGSDQWQLLNEIKKLALYNPQITAESIDELVVPNLQQTAFMITDAIIRGEGRKAVKLYHNLSLLGEPDQKILGAIVYQYRVLVLAKDNQSSSNKWIKELGVSPYAATKAQNLVRNIKMDKLKTAYQLIVECDLSVKTGERDSRDAMEDLIYKLSVL